MSNCVLPSTDNKQRRVFSPVILFHDHRFVRDGSGDLEHVHIPYRDPHYVPSIESSKKRIHQMLEDNGRFWADVMVACSKGKDDRHCNANHYFIVVGAHTLYPSCNTTASLLLSLSLSLLYLHTQHTHTHSLTHHRALSTPPKKKQNPLFPESVHPSCSSRSHTDAHLNNLDYERKERKEKEKRKKTNHHFPLGVNCH
ncbi:hypothetical protein BDB00DRAFT_838085 [Zychaea mexicana]|uniref:uncharacterized protein n=1 Tax=Zychaea mexicana TaxID=64656 RepID=UPI0022FDE478|nr:uncharacterized protein BDB00DRAFT_838085 [Zychaea mexicana]KAI9490340.1 hypothetical protein BDB00DRAFT_838085 [Zychaea mexicana]